MSKNEWQAVDYRKNAAFVANLSDKLVNMLEPRAGERILDLGCGDGVLSKKLVDLGCDVVGIDSSHNLVAAAQKIGISVVLGDARTMQFEQEFDAVFSNAVLHWIPEAALLAKNVFRALKPGGRFVAEFGGHGNIAAIMTAIHAVLRGHGIPCESGLGWYYPTVDEYSNILTDAGFELEKIELQPRQTPLPTGMEGWLGIFRGSFLKEAFGDRAEFVKEEIIDLLRPALCDSRGNWVADYVRLRFKAIRPQY